MTSPLLAAALAAAMTSAPAREPGARIDLQRLYTLESGEVRLAREVRELDGRQVLVHGYMVQMEEPSRGAFYVAPRPVFCDESGGGTGDLPVNAVRVELDGRADDEVVWEPGPVEIVGTLVVGRVEHSDGRVSPLRVVVSTEGISSPSEPRVDPARSTEASNRRSS